MSIKIETSLQTYFFDELQKMNSKSTRPLPTETIFYSSLVMDKMGESKLYFETVEGKVRDKILGVKLLEASNLSREGQKTAYRDIAETSLLLCGYFAESLNKKIVDYSYYQNLGEIAYSRLNSLVPEAYHVPSFFKQVSHSFSNLANVMTLVSQNLMGQESLSPLLILSQKVS